MYCIKCNKYRKFKNSEISYIFNKTLVLFIIYNKCGSNESKILKEEEPIEILQILGLINGKRVNFSRTSNFTLILFLFFSNFTSNF